MIKGLVRLKVTIHSLIITTRMETGCEPKPRWQVGIITDGDSSQDTSAAMLSSSDTRAEPCLAGNHDISCCSYRVQYETKLIGTSKFLNVSMYL